MYYRCVYKQNNNKKAFRISERFFISKDGFKSYFVNQKSHIVND